MVVLNRNTKTYAEVFKVVILSKYLCRIYKMRYVIFR